MRSWERNAGPVMSFLNAVLLEPGETSFLIGQLRLGLYHVAITFGETHCSNKKKETFLFVPAILLLVGGAA